MATAPELEAFTKNFLWAPGPDGRLNRERIFASLGIPPTAGGLTDRQRKQVQAAIERELGAPFPSGVEIDPAGNLNENEGFGKQAKKWGPLVGAGALTAFGIPGLLPGLLGGGAGGAGTAAGTAGASSGSSLGALAGIPGAAQAPSLATLLGPAPAAAGGGLGGILGAVGGTKGLLGAAGRGLGAISSGQAANRGAEFGGGLSLEQLMLARDREARESGTDAWRKLLAAEHTLSPGPRPALSPYSVAARPTTDAERTGADAMRTEVLKRLQGGYTRPLAADPSLLKPGGMERISGYLAPALSLLGGLR